MLGFAQDIVRACHTTYGHEIGLTAQLMPVEQDHDRHNTGSLYVWRIPIEHVLLTLLPSY